MATSVATPLERRLGTIAGVNEMTSSSQDGSAAHQPAVRALDATSTAPRARCRRRSTPSRVDLPATLRSNPTYRKANPSDAPVIILALTSETHDAGPDLRRGVQHRAAAAGAGRRRRRRRDRRRLAAGGARRAAAVRAQPATASACEDVRAAIQASQRQPAQGRDRGRRPAAADLHPDAGGGARGRLRADWSSPGATARRSGSTTSPR